MFLEESMENLSKLNDSLLELEQKPDNLEVVNEIFRVSHTIKGMSATMGYMKMSELTHKMEDVLSKFRDGTLKVNRDVVTLLFKCLDTLESMINNISDGNNDEMDIEAIVVDLAGILEDKPIENINETIEEKLKLEDHHMNIINIDKTPYFVYEIKIVLADTVLLKTARVFIFFREIEKYGDIIHTLPSTQDIETENFDLEVDILYVTMMAKKKLQDIIKHISEIKKVAIKEINSDNVKKSYGNEVFINLEEASENLKNNIKSDDAKSEEISQVKNNRVVNEENINKVQINANNKDVTKEKASKSKKQSMSIKKGTQSVRVDLDRLDMVMNMVSELVIHRTRLEQISNTYNSSELNETLEQIARSTSELQDLVMKIRMLPLEVVFNRFPRMIRDLSLELNKDIQFIIEGASTELDRTVIDEIGEPLIHLLRNAVDHGIETKEKRVEAGKNPTGQIQLYAYQEGTKAVIKIRDDGKGLDVDKIKAKAEKVGISTNGMSDTDIKNLIFWSIQEI